MTVIALASVKGSPGVTTAALAIAARWPAGRKVLLVEADPFGGDLAPRYGATVTGGLASLLAAARRELTPEAVWDHVHELPGGLAVLFGLAGVRQAAANENVWPAIATALAELDADVVVDAGRLLPQFAGGVGAILGQADAIDRGVWVDVGGDRPPPERPPRSRGRAARPPAARCPHRLARVLRRRHRQHARGGRRSAHARRPSGRGRAGQPAPHEEAREDPPSHVGRGGDRRARYR